MNVTDIAKPVPISLIKIREEAKRRLREACKSLVDRFGSKTVANRLEAHENSLANWAAGNNEPRHSTAMCILTWHDLETQGIVENSSAIQKTGG